VDRKLKVFKALCNETRLHIIEYLLDGERCVCEIIPAAGRAQSTTSLQLAKLESLGILRSRREGKKIFYRIADDDVIKVLRCMRK
jgi:ArsR family transcriptional regulator